MYAKTLLTFLVISLEYILFRTVSLFRPFFGYASGLNAIYVANLSQDKLPDNSLLVQNEAFYKFFFMIYSYYNHWYAE